MSNDNFSDLVEGGEPEAEIKSDSKVSLTGEEIPKEVIPEPDVEQLTDDSTISKPGEPEAPKGDQVPEGTEPPVAEPEPYNPEEHFKSQGMDRQFKGGLKELLDRFPETNRYITALETRNKELEGKAATPEAEPEAPSAEDFYNDFPGSLKKALGSELNKVNERFEEMEVKAFQESKPDFKEMIPQMMVELRNSPEVGQLGRPEAIKILYRLAKQTEISRASTEASKRVVGKPLPDKANAETPTGKKVPPVVKDKAYYNSLSEAELEKELGVSSRYID